MRGQLERIPDVFSVDNLRCGGAYNAHEGEQEADKGKEQALNVCRAGILDVASKIGYVCADCAPAACLRCQSCDDEPASSRAAHCGLLVPDVASTVSHATYCDGRAHCCCEAHHCFEDEEPFQFMRFDEEEWELDAPEEEVAEKSLRCDTSAGW